MNDYLFYLFILALYTTLILTPRIRDLAISRGWLDQNQDARKIHKNPVPRLGGIAIYFGFTIPVVLALFLDTYSPIDLPIADTNAIIKILTVSTAMMAVGLLDDIWQLNAIKKVLLQIALIVALYYWGFRISALSFTLLGEKLNMGMFSLPITILWFIGVINAFNLIDGLDGLAAGLGIIASVIMLVVSAVNGHPEIAILCVALGGSLLGFLRFNFYPATIFMGDSGSLFVGFLLAAIGILGAQKSTTAIIIFIPIFMLAIPIFDTLTTLVRRFLSGKPLFSPDKKHLHHRLLELGIRQPTVVVILYFAAAVLGLYSLLFLNQSSRIIGYTLIAVFVLIFLAQKKLGYSEFGEVIRYYSIGFRSQHKKMVQHIQIKNMFEELNKSGHHYSIEEIHDALSAIFEKIGFEGLDFVVWMNVDDYGSLQTFKWRATDDWDDGRFFSIRLVACFGQSGRADLTLYKTLGKKDIKISYSTLFDDFPELIEETLNRFLESASE